MRSYQYLSFMDVYQSGDDQALLNVMGMNHMTFSKLLIQFKPCYNFYTFDDDFDTIRKKVLHADGRHKGRK